MYWQVETRENLGDFLERTYHGMSKASMKSLLRHDLIRVNARVVKQLDIQLNVNDIVERLCPSPGPLKGVDVVYEDEHILILDKPAGLLSVDTDARGKQNLFSHVKERYGTQRSFVVHRLDRETSGLIAFALSKSAEESLKEQLKERHMHRRYMAIVHGTIDPQDGAWDFWVEEKPDFSVYICEEGQGEETLTFYQTLATRKWKNGDTLSLVELELASGKKHQIRVSAAEAGIPLLGDDRYGGKHATRLGLHAYALSLQHPVTGCMMEWISPSVDEFENFWQRANTFLLPPKRVVKKEVEGDEKKPRSKKKIGTKPSTSSKE